MALFGGSIDYTDRDFDALRARVFNLIRSAFPTWTEDSVANFGNILVESFAFIGDVLTFYQDNQAREAFIVTAQQRKNMLALVRALDFKPKGQSPARTPLTVTLAAPPVGDVTISAGDKFSTLEVTEPLVFQAIQTIVILAGTNPPIGTVEAEHSDSRSETFTSNGLLFQEIVLSFTPFLDGSLAVSAADGPYTVVSNTLSTSLSDRHVTVRVDENDRAKLRFPGAVPVGSISADYKTGGGVRGNIDKETIRKALRSYTDQFGAPQVVSVSNLQRAGEGLDRSTVQAIREDGPASLRVLTRTVAREDFEIMAESVPGVVRATMLTRNERAGIPENQGHLIIVPEGGGLPTQALKDAVLVQVTDTFPQTLTFLTTVMDPSLVTINVSTKIVLQPNVLASVAASSVRENIRTLFALRFASGPNAGGKNPAMNFGFALDGLFSYSDVYDAVRDTRGVRRMSDAPDALLLNAFSHDVALEPQQFPALGTITVINDDTGLPI